MNPFVDVIRDVGGSVLVQGCQDFYYDLVMAR